MEYQPQNDQKINQKIADGLDILHSKIIGKIALSEAEHDNFIDDLQGRGDTYPQDAP